MKSPVVKRSIVIAGHKTSVSLEDAFWKGLKEIAGSREHNAVRSGGFDRHRVATTAICRRRSACSFSIIIAHSSATVAPAAPRAQAERRARSVSSAGRLTPPADRCAAAPATA